MIEETETTTERSFAVEISHSSLALVLAGVLLLVFVAANRPTNVVPPSCPPLAIPTLPTDFTNAQRAADLWGQR